MWGKRRANSSGKFPKATQSLSTSGPSNRPQASQCLSLPSPKVKVTQSRPTLWPHRLYSPWNSLGQNTGVGSLSLLQGIFPTQGSIHISGWFFTSWATREAQEYGPSWPRNWIGVSCIAGGFFTSWVTRETLLKPVQIYKSLFFCQKSCRQTAEGSRFKVQDVVVDLPWGLQSSFKIAKFSVPNKR